MSLDQMYDMEEVAKALKMSVRWIRARVADGAEHTRFGHKVRFTEAQVEKLRAEHTKGELPQKPVTTGRKRSR